MITLNCLVSRTGMGKTRIREILHFLEASGYLQHQRYCKGRFVVIPLIEVPYVNTPRADRRSGAAGRRRVPGEPEKVGSDE